ncbi:MAG: alkaline phosphatase [Fusobacteriaceae bacterium]
MKKFSNVALAFMVMGTSVMAQAKYVFYFIGDGLGSSQRQVAEYYKQDVLGKEGKLLMNTFPVAGINTTHAKDTLITDSAAAGTALATGYKTNNGLISQLPDGTKLKTLTNIAQEKNMKTGIVSTTRLTHATPAVFAAANESRANENEIAADFTKSGVDYFAGGGFRNFTKKGGELTSSRKDDRDLVAEFQSKGYSTFIGENSIETFKNKKFKGDEKVFAAFTASHLPYEIDRKEAMPSLAELTGKGIEILGKNRDGFFMMVEGGRIDHASHAQDALGTVKDVLAMDDAVKVAYDFYQKNPKDTLIVIAGDHETGGLGLGFGNSYFMSLDQLKDTKVSVEDTLQKAYTGNRAEFFQYISKNLGLSDLTGAEKKKIENAMDVQDKNDKGEMEAYGGYKPVAIAAAHILSERAGVHWTSFAHTGTQIPLSAIGKGAENFTGFKDNTEIAKGVAQAMGGKL